MRNAIAWGVMLSCATLVGCDASKAQTTGMNANDGGSLAACDPLAPGSVTLGTILAIGSDSQSTLYLADEVPDGGQDRVFVSAGTTLVDSMSPGPGAAAVRPTRTTRSRSKRRSPTPRRGTRSSSRSAEARSPRWPSEPSTRGPSIRPTPETSCSRLSTPGPSTASRPRTCRRSSSTWPTWTTAIRLSSRSPWTPGATPAFASSTGRRRT